MVEVQLSAELNVETGDLVKRADIVSKKFARIKQLSNRFLSEIQAAEEAITSTAIEHELEYAEEFKIWAADAMLELFVKINRDVKLLLRRAIMKQCFRYLRLPIMERSEGDDESCSDQNWVRIGTRFQSIDKRLPYYRKVRTVGTIQQVVEILEKESLNTTEGLSNSLNRRAAHASGFHKDLARYDFKPMIYYNNRRLLLQTCCVSMIFYRWAMDTQKIVFRKLENRVADMYDAKTWRNVLLGGELFGVLERSLISTKLTSLSRKLE